MEKKKILIVDDEYDFVDLVKIRLEKNGYQVVVAYDGGEALAVVTREKPDLILLDILMPKIDGIKVCQKLKSDPATAGSIIIIMLTAKARPEDIKLSREAGADEYIIKPFDDKTLLLSIQQLLNRVKRS